MDTVYSQFAYGLLAMVVSALFAAAIKLIPKGIAYLETQAEAIGNTELRDAVETALSGLESIVSTVVTSVQQTTVTSFKAASQTGKLTAEQVLAVKGKVVNDVNAILGDEAKQILGDNYGNLDYLISHLIEEAVFHLPEQISPVPDLAPTPPAPEPQPVAPEPEPTPTPPVDNNGNSVAN